MSQYPKNTLGITDLIHRIKKDLLSEQNQTPPDLFSIDELTLEISFVISGDIESGFDLGVVTLGSQISEERIQKVTIKLTPLMSKSQLIERLKSDPKTFKKVIDSSYDYLTRGTLQTEE